MSDRFNPFSGRGRKQPISTDRSGGGVYGGYEVNTHSVVEALAGAVLEIKDILQGEFSKYNTKQIVVPKGINPDDLRFDVTVPRELIGEVRRVLRGSSVINSASFAILIKSKVKPLDDSVANGIAEKCIKYIKNNVLPNYRVGAGNDAKPILVKRHDIIQSNQGGGDTTGNDNTKSFSILIELGIE